MSPLPRIDETRRTVADLARKTLATYRAYKAIGMYHLAASDTRLLEWPPREIAGASLGDRADYIEVVLTSEADEGGGRGIADSLTVTFLRGVARELVLSAQRTPQDTLHLDDVLPAPDLLGVLRWACREASEGSY